MSITHRELEALQILKDHGDTLKDLQGGMFNYIRSIGEPILDLDELESVLDCKREEENK